MIKNVRVDHRLVHGQVAVTWTRSLGTDCILVASDSVAKDELRMAALRMAKPSGVKLVIKSIADSVEALNSGVTDKYNLFILTENVESMYQLVKQTGIKKVTLGGSKNAEGKKQISMAFFVSDKECEMIRELGTSGVELEIRQLPNEPAQDPLKLI